MKKMIIIFAVVCLGALFVNSYSAKPGPDQAPQAQSLAPTIPGLKVNPNFGRMPLYFIPNEGQMEKEVAYYVQGKDKTLYFTSEGMTFVLSEPSKPRNGSPNTESGKKMTRAKGEKLNKDAGTNRWVVKLDFVGANPNVRPVGEEKTGAAISYFKGKHDEWHTGLPTYSKIVYSNLWPGIDLAYSGTVNKMKYEFIVHPGADPSQIRLAYRGVTEARVNDAGQLEVMTPAGGFQDDRPVAYQEVNGKGESVPLAYKIFDHKVGTQDQAVPGSRNKIDRPKSESALSSQIYGFEVGPYDPTVSLILDPAVLVYCGYVGGSGAEDVRGIAVDSSGNAYIAGITPGSSAGFPLVVGPDLTHNGSGDVFVAKINAAGTALVYCGYIGGSQTDKIMGFGHAIAVDSQGCAYVVGSTNSDQTTFPVLGGPDLTQNGNFDAFVAKVKADGTGLVYCGYIGGSAEDTGWAIAVDSSGCAYVTGQAYSDETTFPVATGPSLTSNYEDAFVAKVKADGSGLVYCGFIGGYGYEHGDGIAVDSTGAAYVVGTTESTESQNFPVTVGPDLTSNGAQEAFIAKVKPDGSGFVYCGYIGGAANDGAVDVAVDAAGNAYVGGPTESDETTFPVAVGPDLTFNNTAGYQDGFVAKVKADGPGLDYCGYIGGANNDSVEGVALDSAGCLYVCGVTSSTQATFPVSGGPDLTENGGVDAFVGKVKADGTGLIYCGYIGGQYAEIGYGIAVDSSGNAYVTGQTYSTEATFPVLVGPDLTENGNTDAFVARISATSRDDLIGTWDGQGVYFRNSETTKWVKLASPADLIAAGDLDGDGKDDLIGIWPGQGGVWVRYSKTGAWAKLSTTAKHIAAGDMNGDGRVDLLGTWDGQGVFYRDSISALWVKLASPATLITTGDLDGDSIGDLVGIWPTQGGVWVKYSKTGTWAKLSSSARDITTGDMNGDGRTDLVGTWDGQGVYYRDSMTGAWIKMSVPGEQITAGDLDGDGKDDLIGLWASQGGVWVKYSKTGAWSKLSSPVKDMAAGLMRGAFWGSGQRGFIGLQGPVGGYAEGPLNLSKYKDLSSEGPGGWRFAAQGEKNLIPQATGRVLVLPGPGDPGFVCTEQHNLIPQATAAKEKADKQQRQRQQGERKRNNKRDR